MKAILNRKLNTNAETNVFSLLKYVNTNRESENTSVPFASLPDSLTAPLKEAIDSVNYIATQFIERDKSYKTDGKVTYKYISDGYLVLQMMKTMLVLRSKMPLKCEDKKVIASNDSSCNMQNILNNFKSDPAETVETFHEVFNTCEESPESMKSLFADYLQGFDNLKDESQRAAISSMCGALARETNNAKDNEDQQTKTMNIIIGQFGYSDIIDDDGDGCVDEELYDGEDNDGDGEIDEDISDKTNEIEYDNDLILKNVAAGHTSIRELRIIKKVAPNEKYKTVDIDMNGKTVKSDDKELESEWKFVYPDYKEREAHGDHRLVFAQKIVFNPLQLPYAEFSAIKKAVAKDTHYPPAYDLEYRKAYIGGCWVNYDENRFMQWFAGRK